MIFKLGTPIYDQWKAIKTGEEAIAFFAKHGHTTPIKFLHCNRAITTEENFRPYDLSVVTEKDLKPEHFTISAQGVVHVCPEKGANLFHNTGIFFPFKTHHPIYSFSTPHR